MYILVYFHRKGYIRGKVLSSPPLKNFLISVWLLMFLKLIRMVVPFGLLHICVLMGDDKKISVGTNCIKSSVAVRISNKIIILCNYYLGMYRFMPEDGVVLPIELDLNHNLSIKYTQREKRTSPNYAMIMADRRDRVVAAVNYRFCGKLTPSYFSLKSP